MSTLSARQVRAQRVIAATANLSELTVAGQTVTGGASPTSGAWAPTSLSATDGFSAPFALAGYYQYVDGIVTAQLTLSVNTIGTSGTVIVSLPLAPTGGLNTVSIQVTYRDPINSSAVAVTGVYPGAGDNINLVGTLLVAGQTGSDLVASVMYPHTP